MRETIDQMAPNASPGTVSKKSGVRRVNNLPMYLLGVVLGLFLLIIAMVAMDRSAKQNAPITKSPEKAGNTSMFAKEITGDKDGGIVAPEHDILTPDMPISMASAPFDPILIARPDNLDMPPTPPISGTLNNEHQNQSSNDDEVQRIRMAKLQMLEEAIKSKTNVQVIAPRSAGSALSDETSPPQTRDEMLARLAAVRQQIEAQRTNDPTATYQARLAQLRNVGGSDSEIPVSGAPTLLQTSGSTSRDANNIAQFEGSGKSDRWRLDSQPEAPRSPYELRAGFVVPATLISGINSELPGQIMAQVSQNVFDTPTGKYLLIPQGSRLIGMYSSDVIYGQSRILIAWQRIVFPDGKALDIGSMPGGDSAGYAGLNDKVNNHYFRVFSSAFLMSGVTAGIALSQDKNNNSSNNRPTASSALSEALGQQLGQVTAQMIAKNLNIAPTLEIRPGYRFNVIVTKDMTFSKPYRSFDY
ncbi:TrbI/VirB10 family protein [Neisseriaceae bacterium ESL0693]|nr:TrbI/VirB10 family protein [Neisseriaceae bacterium ESL0693]